MESNMVIEASKIKDEFMIGFRKAMPIALGYFPISFTFGIMATSGGI